MSKGRSFINALNNKKKRKRTHHFKHILIHTGCDFEELLSWRLEDNHGNSINRKIRRSYRKMLARKAKKTAEKLHFKNEYLNN